MHTEEDIFYKAVAFIKGKYLSLCYEHSEYYIEYKINEFVKPKLVNSKLCVFSSFDGAVSQLCYNVKIFKCKVKNPSRPKKNYRDYLSNSDFEKYWNDSREPKPRQEFGAYDKFCLPEWPVGTIHCDEVMLLKELPI